MNKIKWLGLIAVSLLVVGCIATPHTSVNFQKGTFTSPKDDALQGVEVDYSNNNGVVHTTTKIAGANAQMNPAVIQATAAGQVALVNSYGAVFLAGADTAAKILGQLYGIPVPTVNAPVVPLPTSGSTSNTSNVIPAQ